jgi:hypothetical protein
MSVSRGERSFTRQCFMTVFDPVQTFTDVGFFHHADAGAWSRGLPGGLRSEPTREALFVRKPQERDADQPLPTIGQTSKAPR